MKKVHLLILIMFGYAIGISQTATVSMPDLSGYNVGDEVVVPVTIDAIEPTGGVSGFL